MEENVSPLAKRFVFFIREPTPNNKIVILYNRIFVQQMVKIIHCLLSSGDVTFVALNATLKITRQRSNIAFRTVKVARS